MRQIVNHFHSADHITKRYNALTCPPTSSKKKKKRRQKCNKQITDHTTKGTKQAVHERSPRNLRASWMSLGWIVTRLAWIAAKLVSSNNLARANITISSNDMEKGKKKVTRGEGKKQVKKKEPTRPSKPQLILVVPSPLKIEIEDRF